MDGRQERYPDDALPGTRPIEFGRFAVERTPDNRRSGQADTLSPKRAPAGTRERLSDVELHPVLLPRQTYMCLAPFIGPREASELVRRWVAGAPV
jgi:hypothetical protein